jgi:VIT1/CCC1 family predicted Fe2+/Mn2+ transporter
MQKLKELLLNPIWALMASLIVSILAILIAGYLQTRLKNFKIMNIDFKIIFLGPCMVILGP